MSNVFPEINQAEISRVSELIPEALRKDANALVGLLEEYYRYMSEVNLPSHILNTIEDNYSIDHISEQYISKIRQYIAPYVPNSSALTTQELYSKIVKYFYNARGSRESAIVFFKIFFGNTETEIFDMRDMSAGISSAWIPYTYGIKTGIPLSDWEIPYRALVHPVGFRFFAYLLFVLISQNQYDLTSLANEIASDSFKNTEIEKYFCFKTSIFNNDISFSLLSPEDNPYSNPLKIKDFGYSSHNPTYQPGWFEGFLRKLIVYIFTEKQYSDASKSYNNVLLNFDQLTQISFVLLNGTSLNSNHHLQNLRDEYLAENKFRDPSIIAPFMEYTIQNAIISLWQADNPAQFQNVGSYI